MAAVTVSPGARTQSAYDTWWNVPEGAAVPAVRRGAAALAQDLGFSAERIAEVGIVVTELATNVVRHAGGGELALRAIRTGPEPLMRVLAIDSGPGRRNINAMISDGASSRGTLGIGLGACIRLSSAFDVYSVPGIGTIAESLLDGHAIPAVRAGVSISDLTRPLSGERPCGDTTAYRSAAGSHLLMVADGLGHGPLAAAASRRAAEVLLSSDTMSPTTALGLIHAALGSTRGAAVAIIRYDEATRTLVHAGVGNVVVRLIGESGIRSAPSQPGIVGHRSPRLRETTYPMDDMSAVVLHSDGLTQRWTLDDVPGVLDHAPAVACAAFLRAAASRRDDAGVLVLRVNA